MDPAHGVGRELRDSELFSGTGREVRDSELFEGTVREVRDCELFGDSGRTGRDSENFSGAGREVRDSELFGVEVHDLRRSSSSSSTTLKRRRTLPVSIVRGREIPRFRSRPLESSASKSADPISFRGTDLFPKSPSTPRTAEPLEEYLKVRAELLENGKIVSFRTFEEASTNFWELPWKFGRSREDGQRVDGVPRLTDFLLARLRQSISVGALRDFSVFPDDIAVALISPHIKPAELVRLERENPTRVAVFEYAWARLVRNEHDISELPDDCLWWRELYYKKKHDEALRLQAASERLRIRYTEGDPIRQTRNVTSAPISNPARRRRRGGGSQQSLATMSTISRLRMQMRKERSRK